ncbi:hypothetical protein LEP1GSC051_0514 [Leptospira sp. P2653]|nr:hypothetical protein LEP1GSC051_0514 [Leptospira sp. P2653]
MLLSLRRARDFSHPRMLGKKFKYKKPAEINKTAFDPIWKPIEIPE